MFYESEEYGLMLEAYRKQGINNSGYANAIYGVFKNGRAEPFNTTACHYNVKDRGSGSDYIYSSSKTATPLSDGDLVTFWKALLESNVYGEMIVTKDPKRIVEDKMFVVSTDFPVNRIMHLLILSRTQKEYPQVTEKIVRMVERGIVPELAICLAHYMNEVNKNINFDRRAGGHHECIPYQVSPDYVKNMIEYRHNPNEKTCRNYSVYNSVQDYFGRSRAGYPTLVSLIEKYITPIKKDNKWTSPFPFYRTDLKDEQVNEYDKEYLLDTLAAKQHLILQEILKQGGI